MGYKADAGTSRRASEMCALNRLVRRVGWGQSIALFGREIYASDLFMQ